MGSIETNIYGTPEGDEVYYTIDDVTLANLIDDAKWTEIYNVVNSERSRRGYSAISNPGFSGIVEASDLNALKEGIDSAGYTSGFTGVTIGAIVTATHINSMIDKVQASGAVCLCNCDYCTCNCNYCTCNCHYSCTCNCNYSDERLKTNIKFLGLKNDIKIYSWNYIWDLKTIHYGVIAQELINTKYENALSKDLNGYYMVNYNKLPFKMKG